MRTSDPVILVFLIALWAGVAYLCQEIAVSKGRSGRRWAYAAVFFGVFALIAVAIAPKRR